MPRELYVTQDPAAFRVRVSDDTEEVQRWVDQNITFMQWGKLIAMIGNGSTYCFRYEKDAILFALKWAGK